MGRRRWAGGWLLVLALLLAGCDGGAAPFDPTPTSAPPSTRRPLPTLAPDAPTPLVSPSPLPPTIPPPTPEVQPTPLPSATRPPGGGPAPTLPGQGVELPRDIGFDGGWWAVLFSPGPSGNGANGE